jgi:copper homeostasis protein CutC
MTMGINNGIDKERVNNLVAIMDSLKMTIYKAMNVLRVSHNE